MSTPLIRTLRISPSMSTSSSHAPRSVAPVKYTLRNHARLKSTCSNRAPERSCFTNSAMRTGCHPVPTSADAHQASWSRSTWTALRRRLPIRQVAPATPPAISIVCSRSLMTFQCSADSIAWIECRRLADPSGPVDERERPAVHDLPHHDGRRDPLDAWQGGELLVADGGVVVDVSRDDPQQVVRVAEQPLGIADLGHVGNAGLERGDGR